MNVLLAAVLAVTLVPQTFIDGETLDYNLTWMKLTGGTARMTIAPAEGADKLRITSIGQSSSSFSRIAAFRDEIESIVARDDFATLRYTKRLDERGTQKHEVTTIDDGVATRVGKKTKSVPVPRPVLDPISIIYYLRTLDLTVGKTYELKVVADAKLYTVHAKVLRRDTVRTPAGRFKTVVVEPIMESGGVTRDEQLWIWYSDDERHLPVRIRTEIKLGAVTATLRGVSPGVGSIDPPVLKEASR